MPAPIPFRDFAALCAGIYSRGCTTAAGFARFGDVDLRLSGFQAAVFRRANGSGLDWVVAIAGTQATDGDVADIVADAGFGGALTGMVSSALGVLGGGLLWHQCACAEDMVRNANQVMGRGHRLYITGHSLGGGIAQIVSARTGVPAVAISAPAVTAVSGVEGEWQRTRSRITCLRVRNDPINHTGNVGNWLGRVVRLESPRTGMDAHSIDSTLAELVPSGSFSTIGQADPFAA